MLLKPPTTITEHAHAHLAYSLQSLLAMLDIVMSVSNTVINVSTQSHVKLVQLVLSSLLITLVFAPRETSLMPTEAVSHAKPDAELVPTPPTVKSVSMDLLSKTIFVSLLVQKDSSLKELPVLDVPTTVKLVPLKTNASTVLMDSSFMPDHATPSVRQEL